jgi:hypothetical protein
MYHPKLFFKHQNTEVKLVSDALWGNYATLIFQTFCPHKHLLNYYEQALKQTLQDTPMSSYGKTVNLLLQFLISG